MQRICSNLAELYAVGVPQKRTLHLLWSTLSVRLFSSFCISGMDERNLMKLVTHHQVYNDTKVKVTDDIFKMHFSVKAHRSTVHPRRP